MKIIRIVLLVLMISNSLHTKSTKSTGDVTGKVSHYARTMKNKKKSENYTISQRLLNEILANELVLLMQILNYHWNLVGAQFHDYHVLFDKQYKEIFEHIDAIAERVRAVHGTAISSFQQVLKLATLKEDPTVPNPEQMVSNLLGQYELILNQMRNTVDLLAKQTKDFGSINFLEDLMMRHEKAAWMLRSLIEKK